MLPFIKTYKFQLQASRVQKRYVLFYENPFLESPPAHCIFFDRLPLPVERYRK